MLGGFTKRCHEEGIHPVDLLAHPLTRGMDQRRGRPLGPGRLAQRVLGPDRCRACRLSARLLSAHRRRFDDGVDQAGDPLPVLLREQSPPARQRIELQDLPGGEAIERHVLATLASRILLGAIEPGPLQRPAAQQGVDAVDAGPLLGPCDQVFLGTVGQEVGEAVDLGGLLLADQDRLITAGEDLLAPAGQAPGLSRELRADVAHEAGELLAVVHSGQDVEMIGQAAEGRDLDAVASLGPGEHTDDDLVEPASGPEEEPAVDGAAGDLEESAAFGSVADLSCHEGAGLWQAGCQLREGDVVEASR